MAWHSYIDMNPKITSKHVPTSWSFVDIKRKEQELKFKKVFPQSVWFGKMFQRMKIYICGKKQRACFLVTVCLACIEEVYFGARIANV